MPAALYRFWIWDPVPVAPSPKFHAQAVIVPSGSLDPRPSNVIHWFGAGLAGEKVKLAVGGRFAAAWIVNGALASAHDPLGTFEFSQERTWDRNRGPFVDRMGYPAGKLVGKSGIARSAANPTICSLPTGSEVM